MGSPSIFAGKFTKLLTNKGILNSDGSLNQFDGPKNYIPYAQFEQGSTTGWSLFNTTLTSGLPTGAVTAGSTSLALTATSTNPLSGTYSMQLAAGTSWTAGHGVISSAFTVDRADLGKVLTFKLYYEATAGATNANWSGQVGSQSLAVYIYDVTAGAWVQPAGFLGMNQNSGAGYVTGTFQTSVTSGQQYQIAIVALQAVANPLTIVVDQVFVGPQTAPIGTPVTDWQSYTPTFTGFGTATNVQFFYRRVGDSLEVQGKFTSGTVTATEARVSLPAGLSSFDTNKIPSIKIVGQFELALIGTVGQSVGSSASVLIEPSVNYFTFSSRGSSTTGLTKLTGSALTGSTTPSSFYATIPIQGWSSNVQTSSDTDTRVITAQYINNTGIALIVDVTNITFLTQNYDTSASWNGSTFTAPVSGYYQFQGMVNTSASVNIDLFLWKDSVKTFMVTQNRGVTSAVHGFSGSLYLNAGQIVNLRSDTAATLATNTTNHFININRLSGPSVITATESVSASYNISAAAGTADVTQFNFDNKQWDTHNSVTVGAGAWKFSAPVSGTYSVSATMYFGSSNGSFALYKQGTIFRVLGYPLGGTATGAIGSGSTLVQLNAGEYIDIRNITGGARTPAAANLTALPTLSNSNFVTITRVGN